MTTTEERYVCSTCGASHPITTLICRRCRDTFHCPATVVRYLTIGGNVRVAHIVREYDDVEERYIRVACGPVVADE